MPSFDATLVRVAAQPDEEMRTSVPADSGLSRRTKGFPSPEPGMGTVAVVAGETGPRDAPTRNPPDVTKIAVNNTNSMGFALPMLVVGGGTPPQPHAAPR